MTIGPELPLAVLVGAAQSAILVLVRDGTGGRFIVTTLAAVLGAWAGSALGRRLGIELLAIGDFAILPAVAVAWAGIALVGLLAALAPGTARDGPRRR